MDKDKMGNASLGIPPYRIGAQAEKIAARFLQRHDLLLLQRNFKCRHGELDLIMQADNTIVFTEVKYRKNRSWMEPIEIIDNKKQHRIIKTSLYFLQRHPQYTRQACRFDVVLICGMPPTQKIEWIKNAFQA